MEQRFQEVFRDFLLISLAAFLMLAGGIYATVSSQLMATVSGYLLSFLFVGSNFFVIYKIKEEDNSKFYKQFFTTLGVRFLLVLIAFVVVLKTVNFHQIYFTVSFIISYILHSVIEIISINKILETDN